MTGIYLNRIRANAQIGYRRLRAFLGKGWISQTTRVVIQETEPMATPLFIIGTHRSGTSQLRRIIDSHPNIACPPESFFLESYFRMIQNPATFVGLASLGFDRDQALGGLRRNASYFHEAYARSKNKPRWADKTPQYAFHLDALFELYQPDVQFLFILRHPLDVAYSIWSRGWQFKIDQPTGDLLTDTCRYVLESLEYQLDFLKTHPGISLEIAYDRLNRFPRETCEEICRFLNEPWSPEMLDFSDKAHDFGTEDPIVRGTRGFKGSYENWHAWNEDQQEEALTILSPLMQRLGYDYASAFKHK